MTTQQRLLSRQEAANYCGVTASAFSHWVSKGLMPKPLIGTHRRDKSALDAKLDQHSGITKTQEQETEDQFTAWEKKYNARKITRSS